MKKQFLANNLHSVLLVSLFIFFGTLQTTAQTKTVGLLKHFNGTQENGYVLFAPLKIDTTYLIDKCGKKVHQWASKYTPGLSVYLKPNGNLLKTCTFTDTTFGLAGGRGGIIEEFDWDNNLLWQYKIFNDSLCQHHDIRPLPNGNVLVLAWHAISKNSAIAMGRDPNNFSSDEVWGERLIELKPIGTDSAEIVWQWDLFDHIIQDKNSMLPNYGIVSQNPQLIDFNYAHDLNTYDWIHANSIDYNADLDQIVMSCHNVSEIWIIDHSTTTGQAKGHTGGNSGRGGDILYRWGNPEAYKKGGSLDRKLFRQHNANWIPPGYKDSGNIMIFNNGWGRDTSYSSIDVIKPPLANGIYNPSLPYLPSTLSWQYKDSVPTRFFSQIISGAHRLSNGNTLICSGVQGRLFEVTLQKKIVWEYRNPISQVAVQKDGEGASNNSVFRCTFYPNTYAAFKNKSLTPYGTIEKNPYAYSCNYETVTPKVVTVTPKKNDTGIVNNTTLKITFSEAVLPLNSDIKIYENNTLHETINAKDAAVSIATNIVTITPLLPFKYNSRISVTVPIGTFRDSSNNTAAKIDSSAWFFFTKKKYTSNPVLFPPHLATNISINSTLQMQFSETVTKTTFGNIKIYENNILKQTIPVNSSAVVLSGNTATITLPQALSYGVSVSVTVDHCFKNSSDFPNMPIALGQWSFTTRSLPSIVKLTPTHEAVNVSLNAQVSVEFDRSIFPGIIDYIYVYENDMIKDTIAINGPRVSIIRNLLSFDINTDFNENSRIAITIKPGVLADTFGTAFTGIDSSAWNFQTKASSSILNIKNNLSDLKIYPNPNKGQFTINSKEEIKTVKVFDLTGRAIEFDIVNKSDLTAELKLKNIAAGHYIIMINDNQKTEIIVQ
ncbi:MAG: Ig-like domain-containing protein [Bacteroidota bacterium]